jgi:hypothetical protein
MIEIVESDISAAIFEVSIASICTGIEIADAYLRPEMEEIPNFYLKEYANLEDAKSHLTEFLRR